MIANSPSTVTLHFCCIHIVEKGVHLLNLHSTVAAQNQHNREKESSSDVKSAETTSEELKLW